MNAILPASGIVAEHMVAVDDIDQNDKVPHGSLACVQLANADRLLTLVTNDWVLTLSSSDRRSINHIQIGIYTLADFKILIVSVNALSDLSNFQRWLW